jgi:PAS domain S-box-containing protein
MFTARTGPDGVVAFEIPSVTAEAFDTTPATLERKLADGFSFPHLTDPTFPELKARLVEDHPYGPIEFSLLGTRTGLTRTVQIRAIPHLEEDRITLWAGLLIDITAARSVRVALARADSELSAHLDNTPLAVIEWDHEFRITRWTGQAENVFGWSPVEVVGKQPFEWRLVYDDDAEMVARLIGEMIAERNPRNVMVNRNYTKSGAVIWCEWHNSIRHDDQGRFVSFLSLVLDITQRKTAEEKLARNEARLRAALSSARMIGWEWDLIASRGHLPDDFAAFFGLPATDDYTTPEGASRAVHPSDLPGIEVAWQRSIQTGEDLFYEFRGPVLQATGTDRWFAVRGQIIRDPAGAAVRIVAVTTDITARKQAEAERAKVDRELQEAQKWESLGVMAGGIAHEFNNILTVILGCAGLARRIGLGHPSSSGYLGQIEEASQRAAALCRQMLLYAGQGLAPSGRANLNELIQESVTLLSLTTPLARIRVDLDSALSPLRADAGEVRQVLVNLLMNAGEAVAEGGIVTVRTGLITVERGDSTAGFRLVPTPGRYVRMEISDNGQGMTPEIQSRMFDPFFTSHFPGRGLGLPAVLGIVRTHRGAIQVQSAPGRGTTVQIFWPNADSPTLGLESRSGEPDDRSTRSVISANPSTPLALVVDDEMYIREVVASTLQDLGYEPLLAGDGRAGLDLFRQHHEAIRIAVIDVVMAGQTGDQLLDSIRATAPDIPAVMISGYTDRRLGGEKYSSRHGRTEFLQKPFRPEDLAAAVKRVMEAPLTGG